MAQPVKTLFVTLRRSFAGTRESHIAIIKSLGLSYREQTVEVPNRASFRGAVDKVHASRFPTGTIVGQNL
jgi:large subunit ribosomal protein L30